MMSPMMPMMGQQSRPSSMMSMQHPMGSLGGGLGVPQASQQRAMSMVGGQFPQLPPLGQPSYAPSIAPSMGGGNGFLGPPQGYTPSIAPSERSTIGQPSRYRPVSYAPGSTAEGRTNTLTSGSAGADWNRKSHVPSRLGKSAVDDDEDDESGWAELNKKRQEKADDWKRKKEGGLKSFGSGATSSNGSSA